MLDDFLVRALVGGVLLAFAAGPWVVLWSGDEWPISVMPRPMPRFLVSPSPRIFSLYSWASYFLPLIAVLLVVFSGRLYTRYSLRRSRPWCARVGVGFSLLPIGRAGRSVELSVRRYLGSQPADLIVIAIGAAFILATLRWRWRHFCWQP